MSSKQFTAKTFNFLYRINHGRGYLAIDLKVALQLTRHFNEKEGGLARVGYKFIADAIGVSEMTVMRSVQRMADAGDLYVVWGKAGRGHPNHYWMVDKPVEKTCTAMKVSEPVKPSSGARRKPSSEANKTFTAVKENHLRTMGDAKASPQGERERCAGAHADPPAVAGAPLTGRAPASEERKQAAAEEEKEEKNGAGGAPQRHGDALVGPEPPDNLRHGAAKSPPADGAAGPNLGALVVPDAFDQLRSTWVRPWPDNDDTEARAAFNEAVRKGVDSIHILAAAAAWVEAADAPRFLPKLSDWLTGRCWEREPPKRRRNGSLRHTDAKRRSYRKPDMFRMALKHGGYVDGEDGGLVWPGQVDDDDGDDALVMGGLVQ